MSPDKPFELRGGTSPDVLMHNRIAAIERIKYLSGVDLLTKSNDFLKAWDLEMYVRFYRGQPNKTIDEDFCQKAAQVLRDMEESGEVALDEAKFNNAVNEFVGEKQRASQHAQGHQEDAGKADQSEKS